MKRLLLPLAFLFTLQANAQLDKGQVLKDIRSLYPSMEESALQTKISKVDTPLRFFRTFVPYYYLQVSRNQPQELAKLMQFSGWCTGDAHVENFGIMLAPGGQTIFSMNDLDDGGPCPIYADFLRFLISIKSFDPNLELDDVVEKYQNTLFGKPQAYSKTVNKLAEKASQRDFPDEKLLDENQRFYRDQITSELDATQQRAVEATLANILKQQKFNILDSIIYVKEAGGSGGLLRFRILLKLFPNQANKKTTLEMFEFKTLQNPGIAPMARGTIPPHLERIKHSVLIEEGAEMAQMYSVQNILGKDMLIRIRKKGNIGIKMSHMKEKHIPEIIVDEAIALGKIHFKSTDDLKGYRKAFADIPLSSWETVVNNFTGLFNEAYELTR